ncbi:hypothetical protein ACGYLO_11580 [Sulfitobacter sp. 1A13353]|uniref:hypothetical protein n=1 Tax=Sulfitobacter sp. 1A13353 TaxID=3368568 RepID=UPI0037452A41
MATSRSDQTCDKGSTDHAKQGKTFTRARSLAKLDDLLKDMKQERSTPTREV